MKRHARNAFPLLFALLTAALYLLLHRPGWRSAGMTSACLVLLTALGWSALIVFGERGLRGRCVAYPAASLLASVLLVLAWRPFPVETFSHWIMIGIQALGTLGIALYLRIVKREGRQAHDG
jgi:hypothetical protein